MPQSSPSLQPVRRVLAGLRGAMRRSVAADGLARVLATVLAACLVSFGLDYALELDRLGRLILGALLAGSTVWVTLRTLVRPLRRPLDDVSLASLIEKRRPGLFSVLSSGLAFEGTLGAHRTTQGDPDLAAIAEIDGADPRMMQLAIDRAAEIVRNDSTLASGLVAPAFLWKRLGVIALVVAAGIGAAGAAGELGRIWFARNVLFSSIGWPKPTTLFLEGFTDGVLRLAHGESVSIVVRAEGKVPPRVWLEASFEDGAELRELMSVTGESGVFSFDLENIVSGGELNVTSVRSNPASGRIHIVPRPTSHDLVARLDYPAYLRRDADMVASPTSLELPAGTGVRLSGRSDKPLERAWVVLGEERTPLELTTADSFEGRLVPARGGVLQLRMMDTDGLGQETPPRLELTVLPDDAPEVTLDPKGVGAVITPQASIRYSVLARDDHGLASAEVVVTVVRDTEEQPASTSLADGIAPGTRQIETSSVVDVEPLALVPSNVLRLHATASDSNDVSGPGVGSSDSFELKVVTVADFMTEMHRRQLELRREFERAVIDQGKLVDDLRPLAEASEGGSPEEVGDAAVRLERLERAIGRRVSGIAARFRLVLEELETNKLADDSARQRIGDEIARPLEDVGAGALRVAGETLGEAGRLWAAGDRPGSREGLKQGLSAAEAALSVMRSILDNMLKQETYSEVLKILREVMRLHGEAGDAAEAERRRRILDVLEGEGEDR